MQRTQRRLRRTTKKSSNNWMYIVILILLVIFFMTFGLQIILGTSRFIAGFNDSPDNVSESRDNAGLVIAPELFDIPDATNSARLEITGRTSGKGTVKIFVNDSKSDEINITGSITDFDATISLKSGKNEVYAEFKDEKGRIKDSETYKVTYLKNKPTLDITSPTDGATYDSSDVTVAGSTSDDVTIKINGSPIVPSADGSFRHNISLKEGENTILITATDIAGNVEEKEVKVTYEKD